MLRSATSLPLRRAASAQAPRLARAYATPAASIVAAPDDASPTAAISVIVKAGSRYESAPGVAHVVKNSVFKGTSKRSAIRLVRETELQGGVLSASLTREHLILTAEFLKGDEDYFAEVLGDALTKAKFAPHEYNEEVVPSVATEYEAAIHDPATYSLDLAHQLAFRTGLGNSLYASPHTAVEHEQAVAFANSAFSNPSNFTVVSTGVQESLLKSLVYDFFTPANPSSPVSSSTSSYYGGELRVPALGHSPVDHLLLAFKGEPVTGADFAVLRYLLGGEAAVKWSQGATPFAKLSTGLSSVKAFNLGYSDAGLFGMYVSAPTAEVQTLASQAVSEIKKIASGPSAEAVKQAVLKAKFAAAAALDERVSKLEALGSQVLASGSSPSIESVFKKLDGVTADSIAKAATSALKSKPTTVAYGNTHELPYADSLSL